MGVLKHVLWVKIECSLVSLPGVSLDKITCRSLMEQFGWWRKVTCFSSTKTGPIWSHTFPLLKIFHFRSANLCTYSTQATTLQPTATLFLVGKKRTVAKFHKWGKKLANQWPTIWFAGKKLFAQFPPLLTRSQVNTFKSYRVQYTLAHSVTYI